MNSLRAKNNLLTFKRDYDNLIELSFKKREEGDYIGALSILLGIQITDGNPDIYAHIADIYADMDLNEKAVNYWYKFLRHSKKKYFKDAYNGLGANFFLVGNLAVAGYYFNKQLEEGAGEESVYEDVLEDYFDAITEAKNSSYKVVYPVPKEKEQEDIYDSGKEFLAQNEYEKALERFEKIEKGGKLYLKAKVEKALALFYLKRVEEAFAEVKEAISSGEKTVDSLSLAINAAALIGTQDALGEYIDMLLDYDAESDEEKFRKLTLLMTLNLVDEALEYSDDILKIFKYQPNCYQMRGAIFYNKKEYAAAEEAFRFSNILSKNPITEFYREVSLSALNGRVLYEKIDTEFELPESEEIRRISIIKDIYGCYTSNKEFEFPAEMKKIAEWVFYENNQTLQIALAILIAIKKDKDCLEVLFNALISTETNDEVKHRIISILCENGIRGEVAVVYGYVFRKIKMPTVDFKGEGEKTMTRAHAYAFGRLTVIDDKLSALGRIAKILQQILIDSGNVDKVEDIPALACFIYLKSGLKLFDEEKVVYKFFGTERARVEKIIELLNLN